MNTASPDDIDISALWRSLRRSVPKLLALSIAAGIAAYVILSFLTPEYSSEAQIQLVAPKRDAQTSDAASAEAVAARMDKEAINTHVRALMSPDLAVEVINAEGLAKKPEFNSALQPPTLIGRAMHAFDFGDSTETEQERVLRAYFDSLDVYSPKESRFIGIRFTSADPKLSAAVANRSPRPTADRSRPARRRDRRRAAGVAAEDRQARQGGRRGRGAVEQFRAQANIFKGGPNNTGLNQQQLGDINAELTKAQGARSEAEARAQSVREMVKAGNAESLPDVQRSPLIQNLVQQRVRSSGSSPSCQRRCCRPIRACASCAPTSRSAAPDQERSRQDRRGIEKSASIAASREARCARASKT